MSTPSTESSLRLGDKVSGIYYDTAFVGTITGFDCSGGIMIDFDTPIYIAHSGNPHRDSCYISDRRRAALKVIERASNLTDRDVIDWQGHCWLRPSAQEGGC